jgi:class 3 adenylate cyclase/tetratricopeptide (TPR) repeat protein
MLTCPTCGRENPEGFAFCGYCRSPLVPSAAHAEVRKTVTVLFCDVTGSTSLGEQLDSESTRRVMSRFFEEMRVVLERHGGTVEKFIGDAVMAVFGIPSVHEDDALRAVRAAAQMREALDTLNKELERDRGVTIASRIGVNTGEVVAGDPTASQALVTGDAVNVAARLEQAAGPGQILIGEPTLRLVRDAVKAEAVEPLTLKGKAQPVRAYALMDVASGAAGVARRLDAPMVGRKDELEALHGALARATRDRGCVLATVIGVPGVGKSRLVDELVSLHEADAVVVQGRCLSYGEGITYWPVVEILTVVAGIAGVDGPDEIRSKIGRLLEGSSDAEIVGERLAEFLGLSGATAAPEETHWAVRKLFEALATPRPLVAVFDDIHWAEPALLDLIEHVVTWSGDAPIVLLCTARPELLEERPDWATTSREAISLRLEPLTHDESGRLIENLIGSSALPEEAGSIVDTAEGNPLFLEHLVGMLIDDGHLRRDGNAWVAVGDLSSLSVPPTITGILEARLERLSSQERDVLERGSVEGRVFHWASVTALSDGAGPVGVGRDLLSLVRRGLIGPAPALFGGGEAFRFRHALIRDAAYARLPKSTRAELHERHARWLERTAGDRLAEFEDVLAYHLEQASLLRSDLGPLDAIGRELAAEAAHRLTSGGRRAAARGDVQAAITLLDRALVLLGPDDPTRPDVSVRLGEAAAEAGDPDRAAGAFEEARALAAGTGDARMEMRARIAGVRLKLSFEPEGATEELHRLLTEAIPLFERFGDEEGLTIAWLSAGEVALVEGRGADMGSAFERASVQAERAGDQTGLSEALSWQLAAMVVGFIRPNEAIEGIRRLAERDPKDRKLQAIAAIHEAMALAMQGRFDDARARFRHGHRLLEDLGMTMWAAGTQFSAGWIEMLAGEPAAAEREYRKGMEALRSMGELGYLSTQAAELGQALYEQGRLDEAEEMAGVAKGAGAPDDLSTQAVWRGVRAKVLARRGELAPAIALAEEAVAMMAASDFADLRARAQMDLAEVYRIAGRREEAVAMLRETLDLLERTGIVPLIERVRAGLAELERPTAR